MTLKLVKIQQCEGWVVKILRSECAAFPFEFRLKLPDAWRGLQAVRRNGWCHDSTSHRSIQAALTAAAEAAQWYRQQNPRNWGSPRRPV